MRISILLPFLAVSASVLAACASPGGNYPSLSPRPGEMERLIEDPGAGTVPALMPEEQASLRADLKTEGQAVAAVEADLARLGAELDRVLARARGQGIGTEAWSNAQMALSRFDQARAPLDAIGARLVPLARQVDSLPDTDPDRQAVEALVGRTTSLSEGAQARVDAANRALAS